MKITDPFTVFRITLFIYLLIIPSHFLYGQNNQKIKDLSKENKERRERKSTKSSSDYDYYSNESQPDDCAGSIAECCLEACASVAVDVMMEFLSDISADLWDKKDEIPRIGSGDFILMGGYSSPKNFIIVPRFRYNAAIYSTDLRMYTNYESNIEGFDNYTTIDWQILMFNIVILKEANFRIGTGLLYETFANIAFNEHTANLDIYPADMFKINLEYRFTPDYETGTIVRNEFNAGFYYKIGSWSNSDMYAFVNYMGSEYYQSIWLNAGAVGIQFSLY